MIVREPNREYNLDIQDESCGVIATESAFARTLPFFVYCAGQLGAGRDYFTTTYFLEGFLLFITLEGQGVLSYLGKTYTLGAGDAVLIDCAQFHQYKTLGNYWKTCYIRFDGSAARTYHDYINRNGFCIAEYPDLASAKELSDEIINLCLDPSDSAQLGISLGLTRLLSELAFHADKAAKKAETSPAVAQAQKYIEENYTRKISLTEIARASLLSPYHLSRIFKAQVGMPPHAYLNSVRISNAKRLLLTTRLPVQDICDRVGYSNVNVLIRSFKNAAGMTPTAFRSKNFY